MIKESLWQLSQTDENSVAKIMTYGQVSYEIACLLVNRGIVTKEAFDAYYHVSKEKFHDPFLMLDMERAVERILDARDKGEKITIYGDYDVDGVTSTSILYMFLDEIGCSVDYYIPDRHDEGYGINEDAISKLWELGAKLMISVDTGITAVEQVDHANTLGLDVIITDHHECQELIPRALAIINPKRPDNPYPFDMLAGVGVTFKLIHALAIKTSVIDNIWKYLDIVAVGTVADIVPLKGENRVITKLAFETMPTTWNIGLRALMDVAELDGKKMTAGRIGFGIGPRLNAAGRLRHAKEAVELFVSHDKDRCAEIANELNAVNKERQELEKEIFAQAVELIDQTMDPISKHIIVVASSGWHHGVIGIVASKLVERYYRPVIILAIEDGIASGSARSVEGFSIFEALSANKALFNKFGGHDMAAGMSLDAKLVGALDDGLNDYARRHMTEGVLMPKVKIDMAILTSQVTMPFIEDLQKLEPFGIGNREPVFTIETDVTEVKKIGSDQSHLRVVVDKKMSLTGIGFSKADTTEWLMPGNKALIACTLDINEWRSKKSPQLMIKDIKPEVALFEQIALLASCFMKENYETMDIPTREDYTRIYRYLQSQTKINETSIYLTKLMNVLQVQKVQGLKKYFLALEVFRELGLLSFELGKFTLIFELIKDKKVDLTDSKLYNELAYNKR